MVTKKNCCHKHNYQRKLPNHLLMRKSSLFICLNTLPTFGFTMSVSYLCCVISNLIPIHDIYLMQMCQ